MVQQRGRIPYPQNQYHHMQWAVGLGNDINCGKDKSYYGIYQKPTLNTIVSDVYIEWPQVNKLSHCRFSRKLVVISDELASRTVQCKIDKYGNFWLVNRFPFSYSL